MAIYRVTVINTCSAAIEVEADSADEAAEAVFDHEDMPGSLTVGAFGPNSHSVDEDGWQIDEGSRSITKVSD